jgi:hypothetical protein
MPYRAAIVVFVRIGDLALGVGDTALVKRLRVAVGAIGFVSDAFSLRPFVAGGMTGAIDGAIKAAEGSILSERSFRIGVLICRVAQNWHWSCPRRDRPRCGDAATNAMNSRRLMASPAPRTTSGM